MWSGWAAGRSFFVVEGGGRMADDGRRAGGSGGCVGLLAEVRG